MPDVTPHSIAIQWVADSKVDGEALDAMVEENWQRADRACGAIRAKVLHDAWLKGYSPAQLALLLKLSSSYVGRLVAFGCVVAYNLEQGSPWDTLPTERHMRPYIMEARDLISEAKGLHPTKLIHNRGLMEHVAHDASWQAMQRALPTAAASTGELMETPAEHPSETRRSVLKAGRRGTQTLRRMAKAIEATLAKHGSMRAYMDACAEDEQEKVIWYLRKVYRMTGEILDEIDVRSLPVGKGLPDPLRRGQVQTPREQ